MAESDDLNLDLAQIVGLAAEDVALARRLLVIDDGFCALCEDRALARHTRARLIERADSAPPGAIPEYDRLVADLEVEIIEAVAKARRAET